LAQAFVHNKYYHISCHIINHHFTRMLRAVLLGLLAISAAGLRLNHKTNNVHRDTAAVNNLPKLMSTTMEMEQQQTLEELQNYTFAEFRKQYKRKYKPGHHEYKEREKIFNKNLDFLVQHNSGPVRPYLLAHNKFMDYNEDEFNKLLGYKRIKKTGGGMKLHQDVPAPQWDDTLKLVSLPTEHGWGPKLTKSQHWMQDQGACGSCWATAAIGCLQSHLEIKHGISNMLSTQALVSCTPNEHKCGGTGGCHGATTELAFEYITNHGIPANSDWPYKSFNGDNGECTPALAQMSHAKIQHHIVLPTNEGAPLLQVLYQEGPVVVSVAASTWSFYDSGVFSGCPKDAVINHAVVAEGYGEQDGNKYYLIKNSWGPDWGEEGYIKLHRFDEDNAHCGVDKDPEKGIACENGPAFVNVCGMCGVLYDVTFPRGAAFVDKSQGGTFDLESVKEQQARPDFGRDFAIEFHKRRRARKAAEARAAEAKWN